MAQSMLVFWEEQRYQQRERRADERAVEIQMAVAKASLVSTGAVDLRNMFPEFVATPSVEEAFESDGPVEMVSDFDPNEALRVARLLERAQAVDTGTLGFADLEFDDGSGSP